MSKRLKTIPNEQREADNNVAKVMGKGLYWIGKSILVIPVSVVKGTAKVVKVVTNKESK